MHHASCGRVRRQCRRSGESCQNLTLRFSVSPNSSAIVRLSLSTRRGQLFDKASRIAYPRIPSCFLHIRIFSLHLSPFNGTMSKSPMSKCHSRSIEELCFCAYVPVVYTLSHSTFTSDDVGNSPDDNLTVFLYMGSRIVEKINSHNDRWAFICNCF